MTSTPAIIFTGTAADAAIHEGSLVVVVAPDGTLRATGQAVDALTDGLLSRYTQRDDFAKLKPGHTRLIGMAPNLKAASIHLLCCRESPAETDMQKAGARVAAALDSRDALICLDDCDHPAAFGLGLALRSYRFQIYKTQDRDDVKTTPTWHIATSVPDGINAGDRIDPILAGVTLTRDLVNQPANILTTSRFSDELLKLEEDGVDVTILEEDALAAIGMRALLAVGQGSASPSRVAVLHWRGAGGRPVALLGKGVVFDTGGISIKPSANMEEMTMDMAGAGVVAGCLKALALARSPVNVVGVVGLVENMPDGNAQRPGDIVRSLKGDTIEIINTDAEGRLVLADLLWWVQETYQPKWMIDLATLTGAIIISLGKEYAGAFANNDSLMNAFARAASAVDEKVWRQPLDKAFDKPLESRLADMKNVGNREAGSITAAMFLKRFVKDDCPWIHLDIAGVASTGKASRYAPKGP
ncbi:MAG: leucyl aminopeptidase, partial [Rhodobacteraceae bacterium]|nr:leucyl aminopeptidase [Paracoccaceae bacterium]